MKITINSNPIDFQIEKPAELWYFYPKKIRGSIADEYNSENYFLPKFYEDTVNVTIPLIGEFTSIIEMESALHYFYYVGIITPGTKTIAIANENGSGLSIPIVGINNTGVKVDYKFNGAGKIVVRMKYKITSTTT